MTSTELIRMLLKEFRASQTALGRQLGYKSPGTISNRLRRGNMTVSTLLDTLEVFEYELVARPVGSTDPAKDIILSK